MRSTISRRTGRPGRAAPGTGDLLYTGLRCGDAVKLGRQHIRDGVISMRTEKTGMAVIIPLLPELAEIIAVSITGDLAFIATVTGTPMTKESFGNWFRDACKAAGVLGFAHGLRKAGASGPGTTAQPWRSLKRSSDGAVAVWLRFTRVKPTGRGLQKRLWESYRRGKLRTSIPSPESKVRE